MIFLIIIALVLLLVFPVTRCVIFNLFPFVMYRSIDYFEWFFRYKHNEAKFTGVRFYCAGFDANKMGSGKTLLMSNHVHKYYKKYNNKIILDSAGNKKIQKIVCISNIKLENIETLKFKSFEQLSEWYDLKKKMEAENPDCIFKALFVIDEIGQCANNRNYMNNFNLLNIKSILCSRHEGVVGLWGSVQVFSLADMLLKSVCDWVYTTRLLGLIDWKKRIIVVKKYHAIDVLNSVDETNLKCASFDVGFVSNDMYNSYDTHEIVELLNHNKNYFSNAETLQKLQLTSATTDELKLKMNKKARKKINK